VRSHQALALLAVDPVGLGGAVLHGGSGPRRESLLREFDALIPGDWPRRRIPVGISADRLHGGLDLAGTLACGRPVYETGLLAAVRGGVITLPMAERASATIVTGLLALLDGEGGEHGAALLALDESLPDEGSTPSALRERLAFWLEVDAPDAEHRADASDLDATRSPWDVEQVDAVAAARSRLASVSVPEGAVKALCEAALALGTGSTRGELFALRAARAAAALDGRDLVSDDDLSLAAALVLGPRATRMPAPPESPPPPEPPPPEDSTEKSEQSEPQQEQLPDRILAAVTAVLPPELLAGLTPHGAGQVSGKGAPAAKTLTHGRRIGARPGDPRQGARLDIVETLRAAAPWQRLRTRRGGRLAVRKDDFRIQRLLHRTGSTVIIAVDASGSSALQRLGEAKGAVELLLAESYVRRDRVALISFRGTKAELILPPTRSLARARRTLAGLPGGGGTPLAAAIAEGERLARQVARERTGGSTLFVVLSDARANVGLDGAGGRPKAEADAEQAAKSLRLAGIPSVFIDTSPRPSQFAAQLARSMGATYVPLPVVDSQKVCAAVRGVTAAMERSA
jgi:magnesium chelatase subunit D